VSYRIIRLGVDHFDSIVRVRQSAYLNDYPKAVNPNYLEINQIDRISQHFGAFAGNELVAVLRATLTSDPEVFQKTLLCKPDQASQK
jgi:hypothetical protein